MEILSKIKEIFLEQGITKEYSFANVVAYDIIRKLGYDCGIFIGVVSTDGENKVMPYLIYKESTYLPNTDGDEDYEYVLVPPGSSSGEPSGSSSGPSGAKGYVLHRGVDNEMIIKYKDDVEKLKIDIQKFNKGNIFLKAEEIIKYEYCYEIFNIKRGEYIINYIYNGKTAEQASNILAESKDVNGIYNLSDQDFRSLKNMYIVYTKRN